MKKSIITLILVLFLCNLLNAQLFTEQTDIEITGIYEGSVAWGDCNNDGLMDFIITGHWWEDATIEHYYSALFENEGNNIFKERKSIFEEINESSLDWSDYNNDNYLDILLSGFRIEDPTLYAFSEIYKNNADKTFTWQEEINFTKAGVGELKWGDYNNNANNDVLQCGLTKYGERISELYNNNGNNLFNNIFSFEGLYYSSLDWGDYNNDGYLDFIIVGLNSSTPETKIYKNQGDSIFVEQTQFEISNVRRGSVEWGDYNNDGFLDVLISGNSENERITKIYKNINGEEFEEINADNIAQVYLSSVIWGDYNNDGLLDICVTGSNYTVYTTKLYRNNGDDIFIEQTDVSITPVKYSSVAWADYDNDNDLDILLTGVYASASFTSKIYKNNTTTPNIRPNVITNLETEIVGNNVIFSWDEGTDDNQPSAGLNYNIYVYEEAAREHIISGDTVYEHMFVASPQAFTYLHELNGKRLFPKRSHIQGVRENGRVSYILKGIFEDCKTYYWSVQAIDASFAGGEFAPEAMFVFDTIPPVIECFTNTTITLLEGQTEYFVQGTELDPVSVTDNCEIESVLNNYNYAETLQGEYLSIGLHSIEWVVTDLAGMQTNCGFNIVIKKFVNIDEFSENEIKIYPNPATDKITIDFRNSPFEGGKGAVTVEICDIIGQSIFNFQFSIFNSFETIDLSNISKGIYFIKFTENQRIIQTTKLIIQ